LPELKFILTLFRKRGPALPVETHDKNAKRISQNSPRTIENITETAFEKYSLNEDPLPALKILEDKLCGVGLARASLLLSAAYPDNVPFFSNELYRWMHWNETGWNQPISGWTKEECRSLFIEVEKLRFRLGVTATEVEKVAFVLWQESIVEGWFHYCT
jgi:hypothetical protein